MFTKRIKIERLFKYSYDYLALIKYNFIKLSLSSQIFCMLFLFDDFLRIYIYLCYSIFRATLPVSNQGEYSNVPVNKTVSCLTLYECTFFVI